MSAQYTELNMSLEAANGDAGRRSASASSSDGLSATQLSQSLLKGLIEAGGAFALVFIVGRVIDDHDSIATIAASYAFVLFALMLAFSQQHFNAWITLQTLVIDLIHQHHSRTASRRAFWMSVTCLIWVVGCQIVGSLLGALALAFVHNDSQRVGQTVPPEHINAGEVVLYEFIGAFFHAIVMYCTMSRPTSALDASASARDTHALLLEFEAVPQVAGASLFVSTLMIQSKTGASVNFIRSIGPAFVSGNYHMFGFIVLGQATAYLSAGTIFSARYWFRAKRALSGKRR